MNYENHLVVIPTPWAQLGRDVVDAKGYLVASVIRGNEETARRIVACVNANVGIDTDALESGETPNKISDSHKRALARVGELTDQLEQLQVQVEAMKGFDGEAPRAAIADEAFNIATLGFAPEHQAFNEYIAQFKDLDDTEWADRPADQVWKEGFRAGSLQRTPEPEHRSVIYTQAYDEKGRRVHTGSRSSQNPHQDTHYMDGFLMLEEAASKRGVAVSHKLGGLYLSSVDYVPIMAGVDRLTRQLDVLINGAGAAPQATLGDLVSQLSTKGAPARYLPLHTAPKDGTEVDLWVKAIDCAFRVPDAVWNARAGGWTYADDPLHEAFGDVGVHATHWCPKPVAPVEDGNAARASTDASLVPILAGDLPDQQLLQWAAPIAGAEWSDYSDRTPDVRLVLREDGVWHPWDPFNNAEDALALMVKIGVFGSLDVAKLFIAEYKNQLNAGYSPSVAVRRASAVYAAELGRRTK